MQIEKSAGAPVAHYEGHASLPAPPTAPRKGGFLQTFGIDVRVAILTVMIDVMAFSGTILSLGLLYVVEIGAALGLGFITYRIQKAWYGDDHDSAIIKASIIGLITAIPTPISGLVAGPGGLLGLMHLLVRKK